VEWKEEARMSGTPNEHGGVVHQVSGVVGVGSDSAQIDPTQETEPTEDDQ
jgi:hypothetical protein